MDYSEFAGIFNKNSNPASRFPGVRGSAFGIRVWMDLVVAFTHLVPLSYGTVVVSSPEGRMPRAEHRTPTTPLLSLR